MSLDIENKSNIRMPQSGASVLSTSTSTSSASKSAPIQMIDSSKNELLKKLGITLDQYNAIKAQHPDFDTLSLVKQLEIVKTPIAPKADLKVNNLEKQDVKVEKPSVSTPEIKDIKAEYNKKDVNGKTEICYSELARNTYIYGVKDKDKVIAEAHSKEEWDKLSDKEKEAEVTKVKAFIDNDERLKNIKDKYNDKVPDYAKEMTIDAIMRAIHAADAEGISFVDFMKKDEYERKELIEQYLFEEKEFNPSNLNKNDEEYLSQSKMLKSEVTKFLEQKTGEKIGDILDTKSVGLYVKYYNLSEDELLHSALKEKVKNGEKLTDVEQKQYARYNEMMAEPSNQQIVKEAKAQNILELDKEFNTLSAKIKKGETLSPEKRKVYSILKETLNSEENKELRNFGKLMPQPQTDYEKKVATDVENYKAQTKEYVHGADLEAGTVIAYIGNKTDGMSKAEKTEYIAQFIRYNRSLSSSKIFAKYMKECPELAGRVETLLAASSNYAEMDAKQRTDFNEAKVKAANSDNQYLKETGINSANTVSCVLTRPEYSDAKYDEMKLENSESNAKINDTGVLKNTTSANATIRDAETAVKAQSYIINSDYFNDEVAIDTANKTKDFVKGAQARVLNMTTDKNAAATKYVAENDIIKTLHADAQAEAFDGTYNSINKHFKGAEADKYSQSLTSQIKGLDAKAQTDALSTVYRSGNEKAIAVAVNEVLPAIKSPDAQQIALKQAVMELAGIVDTSELQAKFANGALTKAEIAQLSPTERREYYTRLFDNASPAEKIKYLKSIPSGKNKATIYSLIGKYYPTLFKDLIKTDAQIAKDLYSMTNLDVKARDAVLEVIMNSTTSDFVTLRADLRLNADKDFALTETEPVTAKTINNSSIPKGFDTKEIYPKDKKGFYYV